MQPTPGRLFAFPISMHVYKDMVRLPQACRPRQSSCFPLQVYVCTHIEMMGLSRQPGPGWLLAFLISMYMHG